MLIKPRGIVKALEEIYKMLEINERRSIVFVKVSSDHRVLNFISETIDHYRARVLSRFYPNWIKTTCIRHRTANLRIPRGFAMFGRFGKNMLLPDDSLDLPHPPFWLPSI